MVGIQRIGGVAEPANSKQAGAKEKVGAAKNKTVNADDGLTISREAQEAASAAQIAAADTRSEIHADKIAQAKKNLEQNTYKVQEIVEHVAARIAGFL